MNEQNRVRALSEVLSIHAGNGGEARMANRLQQYLRDAGIPAKQFEFEPRRSNLVAELGAGGRVLALWAHMDVDPAGDAAGALPFPPVEKGGRLYAYGATGMKSGLVAMALAMAELAGENTRLGGRVRLLATVGGKTGLPGAVALAQTGYMRSVEALIIGEPSGRRVICGQGGIPAAGSAGQAAPPGPGGSTPRLVQVALAEAEKVFGADAPPADKPAPNGGGIPVIVLGPSGGTAYRGGTYADIRSYLEMIDLYKNIMTAYFEDTVTAGAEGPSCPG